MTTMTEFFMSMPSEFHEARFVMMDALTSKTSLVTDYVGQHSAAFTLGGVGVTLVSMVLWLVFKLYSDGAELKKVSKSLHINKLCYEWAREDLSSAHSYIKSLDSSLCATREELEESENRVSELVEERDDLMSERDSLSSELDDVRDELSSLIDSYSELEDQTSDAIGEYRRAWRAALDTNTELRKLVDSYKELTAMNDSEFVKAA